MNSDIGEVLRDWQAQHPKAAPESFVFGNANGAPFKSLKTAWGGLLSAAGIQDFRWHDMRHHFASKLVMSGVSLYVVKELLGHSSILMTERYAHLQPDLHQAAVEKLVTAI